MPSTLSSTEPSVIAAFLRFWLNVTRNPYPDVLPMRDRLIECTVSPWRGERPPTRRW